MSRSSLSSSPRSPSTSSALRLLLALLACWIPSANAGSAEPPQEAPPPAEITGGFTLLAEGSSSPAAEELDVRLDGSQVAVESATPAIGRWRVVLYFDAPLLDEQALAPAAAVLAGEAHALVDLGEVEIVLADPYPEEVLAATRDAAAVAAALDALAGEAVSVGEIALLEEEAEDGDGDARSAATRRRTEQRDRLLAWLATGAAARPGLLIGPAAPPRPEPDPFGAIAPSVAAAGWIAVAMAGGDHAWRTLVEATGGEEASGAAALGAALERLASRLWVTYRAPAGEPRPLAVAGRPSGLPLSVPRWASPTTPEALAEARARRALDEPDAGTGDLVVSAVLRPEDSESDELAATLEVLTGLGPGAAAGRRFRVTVLLAAVDAAAETLHLLPEPADLAGATGWLYRERVVVPPDLDAAAVVVEELATGLWGAAVAPLSDLPLQQAAPRIAVQEAPAVADAAAAAEPAGELDSGAIRLVPPHKRPVSGRARFQTLVASVAVTRVAFLLDGEPAGEDADPPFGVVLDLGSEARPHTVEAVAYDAGGGEIGRHALTVNRATAGASADVEITSLANPEPGWVEVEARVAAAPGALQRVEFWINEEPGPRLARPPYRARLPVPAPPGPADYVRVAAVLADGTILEDVRLLAEGGSAERVEVNLVQVHAVVTDREGTPVHGLAAGDFRLTVEGEERPIERFAVADEVPLVLGVVIDTSESMWALMPDTQKAAAGFLGRALRPGDRAFLVDFDTRPRLVQRASGDILDLVRGLGRLHPDGLTALYDAIVFSLLQFEEEPGRRAVVLLTDGDDVESRFGPRRCIDYGRELGVPVYVIALGGLEDPRRGLRRIDLEGITGATGGRVFYISDLGELDPAYAAIDAELRSQYTLAFATDRPLTERELGSIAVTVSGSGRSVRAVVGRH